MMANSIFISRYLASDSILREALSRETIRVVDESLLKVSAIRFTHTPKADWIFFSSMNAINFFFSQNPILPPGVRFAVFGKGSDSVLKKYGKKADFVGTGNDSASIAKQFIEIVDSEIVLFPQAIDSLQTVQRWLPFNNIARNLFVYKTEGRTNFSIPECDILVFTSPPNVNAYFGKYNIKPHQRVIVIGTTTKLSLSGKGIRDVYLPDSFDEESLLEKIKEVSRISFSNFGHSENTNGLHT
jgi:uroporphyrinogen-III synthase